MNSQPRARRRTALEAIKDWFSAPPTVSAEVASEKIDWTRAVPYFLIHLATLGVIWVGWSWPAVVVAIVLYAVRVFVLTGFYHRYFSHRSFKVGRITQFVFG